MQRYEEALSYLTRQIFNHKLKPGDKLPTEKQLSGKLNIDKTSLRVALKQLESMQLITIRQGDGMYVRNYMEEAGVDFLRTILDLQEANATDWLIDEYFVDEIWEFWIAFFPEILKLVITRSSSRDIKDALEILDEMALCIDDKKKLVEFDLKLQTLGYRVANNMLITLLFNSFYPQRKILSELFYDSLNRKEREKFIARLRVLVQDVMFKPGTDISNVMEQTRKVLNMYREGVKNLWRSQSTDKDRKGDVLKVPISSKNREKSKR